MRSAQHAEARARIAAHLRRTRSKRSQTRDLVAAVFLEAPGHVSVEELTAMVRERAARVGQSTVYRTLRLLTDCGVAASRAFGDGHTRYECVLGGSHHDHLVCTECRAIEEFEDPGIEGLQEEVARRCGFVISSHKLELYGRCARCSARARGPQPRVASN